jgi:hypothetical protein
MKGLLRVALGIAVFASLLVGAASAMAASVIYGSAYTGGASPGPSTLYTISSTTGVATPIGPIGFNGVGALDFGPNGVLYGVGQDTAGNASLLTINTSTGAGTFIGELGLGGTHIQDIAFRPSDGVLFANAIGGNPHRDIYTVDVTTGVATLLGPSGVPVNSSGGDGTAFSSSNVLYDANGIDLRTINQSNGTATFLVGLTYPFTNDRADGMKFDPASGTLFASVAPGTASGFYLATIDIVSGVVTEIGPTVSGLDAIAIRAVGLADQSEPGSIIVYQKFQRGFVTVDAGAPGQSVQPRSLIELGATCPVDDSNCGVDQKVVRVNFHWVCPPQPDTAGAQFANPSGGVCVENDFFVNLTVNGKVWFSPEGGTTSGDLPGQIVPQAPCNRGYLIGFVTNIGRVEGDSTVVFDNSDAPVRFDGLIGDAVMRNTPQDLQAFRAITIQADPGTSEETALTGGGTSGPSSTGIGTLVLDGTFGNYDAVTGQLSGDVRYDSDINPPFADTALIFLTLDVASNQKNTPTYVNLNFYNAQQQAFSEALSFTCWGQINITTIDASLTQEGIGTARGLFITSQAYNPNSTVNANGAVTLLGAVQITEGGTPGPANATRSYTVPVFDNSVPVRTTYFY